MLYHLSGIGDQSCGWDDSYGQELTGLGKIRPRSTTKAQRKAARSKKRYQRRHGETCKGRWGAKIPLAPARRAFAAMLRLNAFNMAKKMYYAMQHPETRLKILEKWCKFGGNAKALRRTLEKSWKRLKRKGKITGVGEVATGTLAATALPIITAMMPIIKAAAKFLPEGKAKEILEESTEAIESVTQSAAPSDQGEEVSGLGTEGPENVKTLPNVIIMPRRRPNWLLIGAVAAGTYFIAKKY